MFIGGGGKEKRHVRWVLVIGTYFQIEDRHRFDIARYLVK